jgi:hypothetical protein
VSERYSVISWETGQAIHTNLPLGLAKRYARSEGHTGEDSPLLTGYPPVAYVANAAGEVVYNPRFGKGISASVAGLIDAQPSSSF